MNNVLPRLRIGQPFLLVGYGFVVLLRGVYIRSGWSWTHIRSYQSIA
ncbi:hypothetical protein HMPREF9441_00102 [Paraprevotella clara YIT 11840]|uniref:Uncharacterized protein n=1 Tax=Paraprevotella clara YIT 11840 TaxID=762968 RepID=G5SL85_9BACT|nr:hypothetical protein HMPREF9441_00102 [Paraprevotella clara YIT 11840]